jgi:hypothetical protein
MSDGESKQEKSLPEPASMDELPFSPGVGCLLAAAIGLIGALLVFQIVRLIYFGELRFGGPELAPNRVWLVREVDNAGLMISTTNIHSGSIEGNNVCLETNLHSLLWRRDQSTPITDYCLCYQRIEGNWNQSGACRGEASP